MTWGSINDPFICLVWVIDKYQENNYLDNSYRSNYNNKFNHRSTEINAFFHFFFFFLQISGCIFFILSGFPVSEGNCASGFRNHIYFHV